MALKKLLGGLFGKKQQSEILPPPKPMHSENEQEHISSSDSIKEAVGKPLPYEPESSEPVKPTPIPKKKDKKKLKVPEPPKKKAPVQDLPTSKQEPKPEPKKTLVEDIPAPKKQPLESTAQEPEPPVTKPKESHKENEHKDSVLKTPKGQATLKAVRELLVEATQEHDELEEEAEQNIHKPSKSSEPTHKPFYLESGEVLRTVEDLTKAAEHMTEAIFAHHVNDHRNDFAHWIRTSVGDDNTADLVKQVRSKEELYAVLSDGMELLPDVKSEQKPTILLNDLEHIHEQFISLKQDINNEIDESISMLHSQGHRITSLRDEVRNSNQALKKKEQELREELLNLHEKQEDLEDEIRHLREENQRLTQERDDARKVQDEVRKIRNELSKKHEELISARELLQQQLVHGNADEKTQTPKSQSSVEILVDTIKQDLQAGRFSAARNGYNEARDMYYKSHTLSSKQKEILHQELLDLYTQINMHDTE